MGCMGASDDGEDPMDQLRRERAHINCELETGVGPEENRQDGEDNNASTAPLLPTLMKAAAGTPPDPAQVLADRLPGPQRMHEAMDNGSETLIGGTPNLFEELLNGSTALLAAMGA